MINQDEFRARYQDWKSCVDPIYPNGASSVSGLEQQFQAPGDIRKILANLKQAWEKGFLVQPSFFEETTLQKFFAGSHLEWVVPANFYIHHEKIIRVELESDLLPGATISVESICWRIDFKSGSGKPDSTVHLAGSVKIMGGPFSGMTLRTIRQALGKETRDEPATAIVEFGDVHPPSGKGRVIYTDPIREESEGRSSLGIHFNVPYQQSQQGLSTESSFVNDDVVDVVDMSDEIHRQL